MKITKSHAVRFVLLLGAVSLFADMTYEAARSVAGQYLAILGAGAVTVGVVSGLGEFIGYGFRIVSGLLTDRTHRYWPITIAGYVINLLAVPALGLTHNWPAAAVLIIMERFGKSIRNPARDAMLSHAVHEMGRGWGFGVHEAMDQVGAMIGPMIIAAVLAWKGSYRLGFAVLAIPAVLALSVLVVARVTDPDPRFLEPVFNTGQAEKLSRSFWLYLISAAFIALGFADFPLAAFHMKTGGIVPYAWIPIIYSGAIGVDALSALVLGRLYDSKGVIVLLFAVFITALSAPLVYLSGAGLLIGGMALWGIGMGAQESILRAASCPTSRPSTDVRPLTVCSMPGMDLPCS
ncbi:MAG: MFS transporter [Thermodesulfobacteriota bacterium]